MIGHICWIHQVGSPASLKDSRCLGQEKNACKKNAKYDQSEFSKKSTCELCATLRNRGNAFNQAKFSFLKKHIEISKEGRNSKMFTCILQQQLYEGRRSTRPWPEVWHSPRLPRWDGPRSSKAPSWYRLKYVVRFLFALFMRMRIFFSFTCYILFAFVFSICISIFIC